jgi:hypothetical protein
MRRNDKAIIDRAAIDAIIRRATVCRLGLCDDNQPYVVPLCFGYDGDSIYLHSAPAGFKLDLLRKNPRVCVEFDIDTELVRGADACAWGMKFRSVIAFGTAAIMAEADEKRRALATIMRQYGGDTFDLTEMSVTGTTIVKVAITSMTGKESGYR